MRCCKPSRFTLDLVCAAYVHAAVLLALIISASSEAAKDEYAVSFANHSQDTVVKLLPRTGNLLKQTIETLTISNRSLSPECGSNNFRCNLLTVVTEDRLDSNTRHHYILAPVLHGILVIDLKYNGLQLGIDSHYVLDIQMCSPTFLFQSDVYGSIFTLCLNMKTQYFTLYEIYLNLDSTESAYVTGPLLIITDGIQNLSNFIFTSVDTTTGSQLVYFTAGGSTVDIILPFLYLFYQGEDLPQHCSGENTLVLVDQLTFVAYCETSVAYYSILENKVLNHTTYADEGRPIPCPNTDVHLSVFPESSYFTFGVWSDNSEVNIDIGAGYTSGVCFGSTVESTLFAYAAKDGIFIVNPFSQMSSSVLPHSPRCPESNVEPLVVFEDRYLVIRQREGSVDCNAAVTVIDSQQNYSIIINEEHVWADFLAMVVEESSVPKTTDPVEDETELNQSNSDPSLSEPAVIAGSILGAIIILLVVAVTITITAIILIRKRRGRLGIHEDSQPVKDGIPAGMRSSLMCPPSPVVLANPLTNMEEGRYNRFTAQGQIPDCVGSGGDSPDQLRSIPAVSLVRKEDIHEMVLGIQKDFK